MREYVTILFRAFGINTSALILAFMIHVTEWKEYEKTISRYGVVEFREQCKWRARYHVYRFSLIVVILIQGALAKLKSIKILPYILIIHHIS